jgi:hypothetical protein
VRTAVLAAAVAVVALTAGCAGGVVASRAPGTDSSAPEVIPAPRELPTFAPDARLPLAEATPAFQFEGDDEELLARARGYLLRLGDDAPTSESDMVGTARAICSVLSGGGAVAAKVDVYAGSRSISGPGWTSVIGAGIDTYCPELGAAYFADRSNELPRTAAEDADLVRYMVDLTLGDGYSADLSDRYIARSSRRVCRVVDRDPDAFAGVAGPGVDLETRMGLVAAVLVYCPEHEDLVRDLQRAAG